MKDIEIKFSVTESQYETIKLILREEVRLLKSERQEDYETFKTIAAQARSAIKACNPEPERAQEILEDIIDNCRGSSERYGAWIEAGDFHVY